MRAALRWWSGVWRFALLRRLPNRTDEVQVWSMCLPFVLWNEEVRFDGRTFADSHAPGSGFLGRALLRQAYLVFLMAWPLVAAVRALPRRGAALRTFRNSLLRPELVLHHPNADFTDEEVRWGRPDHALGMYAGWLFHRRRAPWFWLDDKQVFHESCLRAQLPIVPRVSRQEAMARGGRWVLKERSEDLGFGVRIVDAMELASLPDDVVLEPVLRNHPVLREVYPPSAPLSSFRVITVLDPISGAPRIARCALRIGRDGVDVDNTQQGGIWSKVKTDTGVITEGVTKHSFGLRSKGSARRIGEHPDSGRRFAGLKIPYFEECKELALEAHRRLAPEAPTLGWDLALAESGPVFLEVNVWTASYDYDPEDDACTPAFELILSGIKAFG